MISHALEWPSLSVQWLPDRTIPAGVGYSVQKIVIGTHTSDNEQNSLCIAEVKLPLEASEIDPRLVSFILSFDSRSIDLTFSFVRCSYRIRKSNFPVLDRKSM